MKAEIEVENPDAVKLAVTITMTAGEWRGIYKSLMNRGPDNGGYWPVGAFAVLLGRSLEKVDVRITERETQSV